MVLYGAPMPELDVPFQSIRSVLDTYKRRHPEKTALYDLDQRTSVTYGELHEVANRMASFLHDRGIGKGDRIALLSGENLEKLLCWMGIWRLGAVVCPLNVELNAAYLNELLANIGPKMILWHEEIDGPALTSRVSVEKIMFSKWQPGVEAPPDELFAMLAGHSADLGVDTENAPDDVAAVISTSGTTALPKCVVHNHNAFWANAMSVIDMLGLTAEDRTLEYRSFGWSSTQVLSLMPWLATGLTLHFAKRFSRRRFFDWIKTHEITFAAGVPTVINMLLNEPLGVTAKDVPSLRLMTCSSAPISPEQWQRFEEMYGVTLLQLYGCSEGGWICGNHHDKRKVGTVGLPAKHQVFEIVDGDGNPCPPGVEGEVTVGGPQLCIAIISPEGEYKGVPDPRFRAGDLAVMDEEGFVSITGRNKDLIIRGGVNIAPVEIDNVVMKHPGIVEASAVGVPDEIYGEEIVCYVVAASDGQITVDGLNRHCKMHLPAFKMPKAFYFIDVLPKNDRGKIRRKDLKALWAKENATS